MAKFIVLGLFVILTLHQCVEGMDMGRCAQLAIAKGVPSVGIPSHDPLVISRNLSFTLNNAVTFLQNLTVEINQITWTNLPWWKILKNTVTKNTNEVLDFEGELWWDNWTISFNYQTEWLHQKLSGEVEYKLEDVTWFGKWEETKPDSKGIKVVNYMNVTQTFGKKSAKITGLGPLDFLADTILMQVLNYANEGPINAQNGIGQAMGNRINTVWYGKPKVYQQLVEWCKSQNI